MSEGERHSPETVARMVEAIEPAWSLLQAAFEPEGLHDVYHLDLETPDGNRECVLKIGEGGNPDLIRMETRLLRVLDARTTIPVATVFGVVDEHDDLPAPFFLMESLPGELVPRKEADRLSEDALRQIARESGRHLAELHELDAMGGYGQVACDVIDPLHGGLPDAGLDDLHVTEPTESWTAYFRESVDGVCDLLGDDRVADGRFADLAPTIRRAVDARLDGLQESHRPVIGHVDCSLENLLVDPGTGEVTGVLDWEFTLAVAPAYDLGFVAHSLAGGPWQYVPAAPDHESLVRSALLSGYLEAGSAAVVDRYREARGLYDLLPAVHSMLHFEDWLAAHGATDEQVEEATLAHREAVEALL